MWEIANHQCIIHTDLKPENILFVNSEYEKINKLPINIRIDKRNNLFYYNIKKCDIKIIDFGSAMSDEENLLLLKAVLRFVVFELY